MTLATTNPDGFSKLAAKIALSPFATYQRLLARVYSLVPDRYAEQAFTFLISDARRLHLASFDCVESRRLIHAIYPYLDIDKRHQLETHIISYDPIYKQLGIKALKIRGLDQLYLLEAIQPEMLSASGKKRILELRHKFPKNKAVDDEPEMEGGAVGSPIPEVIARKMSDKNWLSAMQKYSKGVSHKDFLKGGSHGLAGILTALVKESPTRFYALLQKVPDDVEDEYVTAFINGFSEITENPEWLFNTIRRFSPQPQRNIQRAITWAVEKTSNKVPQDIIALLEGLLQAPMGDDELWWSADKNHGDAFNNFLNSDRGAAFHALMRIWSKEKSNEALRKRWALVELVANDPSTTLRAGAVFWLTSLVPYDRNRAVSIFERLVTGHDILLTLMSTRECLYWSFYQNFLRLSPYIEKIMSNEAETVQEQGAQLACIAVISSSALESPEAVEKAKNLAEVAVKGNVAWRRGAAKIFSINLSHRPKDICESYLHSLITDTDDQVRNHIDSIFHNLNGEHLLELRKFVEAYVRSSKQLHPFFAEFLLAYGLLEPAWSLNIVRQTINNMEPKKQWHTGVEELIRLVLKIYMDPLSDETLRENAMDVFDILMERYSGYTLKILSEWDRQ